MYGQSLFTSLKALIIFRAFFVALLLGTFLVFNIGYYKFPYPQATLYLIALLYLLSVVYAVLLYRVKNLAAFAYIQLSIDAVSEVFLVFLTGGIESWFSSVMLLTVMASAIILDKKAGYIIATLCSILYGLMIDLQFYRVIPIDYDFAVKEKDFLYNIFSHISALYLTAFLTGYLSSRLEKTSKKLAETDLDLKDLAVFNKELIENLPSGLLTTDLSGRILISNRASEEITGLSRTSIATQNITDVFSFVKHPIKEGRIEGTIRRNKDNRIVGLTLSEITAVREQKGYICVFQDITEMKRLEADLKHKETLAALGELSANMAHEIRNPLAALKSSMEMIKEGRFAKDYNEQLMDIALSEMDRLNKVITDFLIYSRSRPPENSWFDLHEMLDETVDLVRNTIMNTVNIKITKNFNGRKELFADPNKLRQVFLNLGINAIESMPGGGELTVGTEWGKDNVSIFFKDSGMGIKPENMKDIFYPFFTTKVKGTGLGLSIAYRIIEEHDGKINVTSSPGKETIFEVIIPVISGDSAKQGMAIKEQAQLASE